MKSQKCAGSDWTFKWRAMKWSWMSVFKDVNGCNTGVGRDGMISREVRLLGLANMFSGY